MRVVLVTTPTRTAMPNDMLPLGVLQLTSYLELHGHSVKVIDVARTRQSIDATIKQIGEFSPDVIGISGICTAYTVVKALARSMKAAFPRIPIIVGGHITIDNTEPLILSAGCDYAVVGYGEIAFLNFLESLEGKRKIEDAPQLSYLRDGTVVRNKGTAFFNNIDEMPFPAYDHIDMEHYLTVYGKRHYGWRSLQSYIKKTGKKLPAPRAALVTGALGCTDKCSFCIHEFEYKGLHVHSIDYVIKSIEILYKKYGARIFAVGEDLFLYSPAQAREFVSAMNSNFPDAFFWCSIRANYVTPELLRELRDSNCFNLFYGFESGDDDILKMLGKRLSRSTNINAYKLLNDSPITPRCSFMVGTPGETRETVQRTVTAIEEAGVVEGPIFFTTPYPGSRLFRWCRETGLIKDVEQYLETVSDRNASVLTVNFTPYPDRIVEMMQTIVQNALDRNRKKSDPTFRIPIRRLIIDHWVKPVLFEAYFIARAVLGLVFKKYRKNVIDMKLNADKTVLLLSDVTSCHDTPRNAEPGCT